MLLVSAWESRSRGGPTRSARLWLLRRALRPILFTQNLVLPATAPIFSAGFARRPPPPPISTSSCAARMVTAEGDKSRYQQAMHFVTHEMRTPLTAIQGSSELMSRYVMPEEKRKQMADLINSESKRLAA